MSQNDFDVTTNAIVSNNLAFISILVFFFGFLVTYFVYTSQMCLRRKILHRCQKANTPEQKNRKINKNTFVEINHKKEDFKTRKA